MEYRRRGRGGGSVGGQRAHAAREVAVAVIERAVEAGGAILRIVALLVACAVDPLTRRLHVRTGRTIDAGRRRRRAWRVEARDGRPIAWLTLVCSGQRGADTSRSVSFWLRKKRSPSRYHPIAHLPFGRLSWRCAVVAALRTIKCVTVPDLSQTVE